MREDKMIKLSTEQMLYLLHAKAYLKLDTITKGAVKKYLPIEWRNQSEEIYAALKFQGLIDTSSKGRFSISEKGFESLVFALESTNYRFNSVKGPKILNALIDCLKKKSGINSEATLSQKMSFDEFQDKFKALYFEERRQQEIRGVVAIRSKEICSRFREENFISDQEIIEYFENLKLTKKILTVIERGNELMQWVE